jgi:hypothetical protein
MHPSRLRLGAWPIQAPHRREPRIGAIAGAKGLPGSAFAPPEYPYTRSLSNRMPVLSSLPRHEANDIAQTASEHATLLRNGALFKDWMLPTAWTACGARWPGPTMAPARSAARSTSSLRRARDPPGRAHRGGVSKPLWARRNHIRSVASRAGSGWQARRSPSICCCRTGLGRSSRPRTGTLYCLVVSLPRLPIR